MKEKCTKFESLFIFKTEDELLEHIHECEDCRKEYEKMQKISGLIKEVAPYFRKKQRNFVKLKVACMVICLALCGITCGVLSMNTDVTDTLKYGATLSAEDLGFPVDSYGLIAVE